MKVIPSEVLYEPTFTYIWSLAEGRFPQELSTKITRRQALREVARTYLQGAGLTAVGELSRVTGLSRPEAGLGNHVLVEERCAKRLATGVYQFNDFSERSE
jgi:hypothetical protein